MSDAIEKYLKAKRSGAYQHPESKKIYDEGPVGQPPGPTDGKTKVPVKTIGSILLALALFGSSGLMINELFNQQPISQTKQDFDLDDIIRVIDDGDDVAEITPSVTNYVGEQTVALAKIAAWERMTREVVRQYFERPIAPGYKRTLCITLDGQKHCRARSGGIDSILE